MTMDELREEIGIELELIGDTVRELSSLRKDVGSREPTVREKTAAAFMAQFYGGVENILKRISRFHSVPLPAGDTWHIDLFELLRARSLLLHFAQNSAYFHEKLGDNTYRTGFNKFVMCFEIVRYPVRISCRIEKFRNNRNGQADG